MFAALTPILRGSCAFLAAAVLASCAIKTTPIGRGTERRLEASRLSEREFGAEISNGGRSIQFTMFTGQVHPDPVQLPMSTKFRGLPSLEVRLNDRRNVRMLVDTGAQLSIVDATNVLAAGGKVYVPKDWEFTVTGIGGSEQAWLARFDTASLGPITLRNFTTVVRRQLTAVQFGGLSVGSIPINLLGCPVLLGFQYVTFDYLRKRFVFSPGTAYQPGPGAVRVPMQVKEQLIYVPLRIGNRTVRAMVDTGAKDQIFLNTKTVAALRLEALARAGGTYRALGLGGETSGRQFKMPLIFLGEVPLRDVVVDTSDSDAWDVRIGSDLLARWTVTFDFARRVMWLEAPTR